MKCLLEYSDEYHIDNSIWCIDQDLVISPIISDCMSIIEYATEDYQLGNTVDGLAEGTGICVSDIARIIRPDKWETKSVKWVLSKRKDYFGSRSWDDVVRYNRSNWEDILNNHYTKLISCAIPVWDDNGVVVSYSCNMSRYDVLVTVGMIYGYEVKYIGDRGNQIWINFIGRDAFYGNFDTYL
jgi:hypothetical protein